MFSSIKKQLKVLGVLLGVVAISAGLSSLAFNTNSKDAFRSVEVAIAELSPEGVEGGVVVPASCPSYSHAGSNCNAEEGDMCFNKPGWQGAPEGNFLETPGVYRLCCDPPTVPLDAYTCGTPCTSQGTQTQTLSCPAGYSGSITQTRTSSCPGPTWSGWTTISDTCTPGTTTTGPGTTGPGTTGPGTTGPGTTGPGTTGPGTTGPGTTGCSPPAGSQCWSERNACGERTEGVVQHSCLCNASPPPNTCGTTGPGTGTTGSGTGPGTTGSGTGPGTGTTYVDPPAETCTLTASPSSIPVGNSSRLTWWCGWGGNPSSNFTTGMAGSGSFVVRPSTTSTYNLQCAGGCVTSTQVTVISPVLTISANPARVRPGDASTISWRATNVSNCTLTGTGINASCSGGSCAVTRTNSTGALSAQSVYTLACTDTGGGSKSASATVFITPNVCEVGTDECPSN